MRFLKPVSFADQLLIRVVIDRYSGVDAPFLRFEDDEAITLKIPLNIKRSAPWEPNAPTIETNEVSTGTNRGLPNG